MNNYIFKIYGMDCAEEIAVLKRALSPYLEDITQLQFDLLNGKLTIPQQNLKADVATVVKVVAKTGMKALPWEEYVKKSAEPTMIWQRYKRPILTLLSAVFIIIGYVSSGLQQGFINALISDGVTNGGFLYITVIAFSLAIITGGWFVVPKAILAAKRLQPDMNLLMLIAIVGAMVIGKWLEAATVCFLFSFALLLETWSVNRARSAIKALLSIVPETAHTLCEHHGDIKDLPVAEIAVGALLIIRPGEKVPLDAVITKGETHINQAPITGESLPVFKQINDIIYAGTINEEGVIECRVLKTAEHTTFAQIIKRVEEAQADRARSEQWVERFAHYYTPAMMILAALIICVPPLFFAGSWLQWFYEGLVILVIACPCALVISTPVSIVAGLSAAARVGILIKGGSYLEIPANLRVIALDKTGTVTEGKPVVQTLKGVNEVDETELLIIAGSLESQSDHPLALAIKQAITKQRLNLIAAEQVKEIKGKGVEGLINGKQYWLGSHRLLHEKIKAKDELNKIHDEVLALEDEGHSLLILGVDNSLCGLISVADQVRKECPQVIAKLKALGLKTVLLTGDNKGTAQAIGKLCHFDAIYSELLPEDKLNKITALRQEYKNVAMVGDGINDAPALASADLGIAMAAMGTDVAIETADIALMSDDLNKLPWLIQHSKRTLHVIKQNISFSLIIKAIFITLAFAKLATLWMAIAADTGASLIVVTNGLRLLKL